MVFNQGVGVKRLVLIGIVAGLVLAGIVVAVLLLSPSEVPPRQMRVTETVTLVPTASHTPTPSPLPPSATAIPSITPSATMTATLAVRVAETNLIMPDVTLPATSTPLPDNLLILAEPLPPVEPLPNATFVPFPYTDFTGWAAFESDHPAMQYVAGEWTPIGSLQASQGQYHYTEDTDAVVRFSFSGEAVRVRYVGFTNGGVWNMLLDGMIVDTIDSYAPSGLFTGTQVYSVGAGDHTLELRNTASTNPASGGHMLAFDAVQVYRPDELTLILPGGVLPSATPSPTLIPARQIELLQAPPSPQPTATDIPIQIVSASLLIGYDENANGVMDVSEGVRGISVRLVEVGTNRVLAQGFTDERGFAELQASTNSPVLLVVPYFGESWAARSGGQQTFTLLLSPGNQPGLIP